MSRAPGMHDVARRARVSHQTVSRVVNGHPHVSPATRGRVEEAIAELGYRRNAAARSLVTNRSGVIGLLRPRVHLYGPTSSMIAVEVAAREAGYFVSLASVAESSAEALADAVNHFKDQSVEAVVLIAPEREWLAAAAVIAVDLPVITLCADFRVARDQMVSVGVDNVAGARIATEHLIGLGHQEIAFVSGPLAAPEATARRRGWRDTMRRAGLGTDRVFTGDWTPESGYRAGMAIAAGDLPEAVFCANDQMALGLLRAFAECGISVPGQVSVVGFDDVPDSAYFGPPLTTVRQDFALLAERSVEVLGDLLREREAASVKIKPELVVRDSTAAAAGRVRPRR